MTMAVVRWGVQHKPSVNQPLLANTSTSIRHTTTAALTWHGQEVINRGDVVHGLGQYAHLLLPLILENIHVVLSHFALGPSSQSQSRIDDLQWRKVNTFQRTGQRSHRQGPERLSRLAWNSSGGVVVLHIAHKTHHNVFNKHVSSLGHKLLNCITVNENNRDQLLVTSQSWLIALLFDSNCVACKIMRTEI